MRKVFVLFLVSLIVMLTMPLMSAGYTCPDNSDVKCDSTAGCDFLNFRDCYYEGGTWHEVWCHYYCHPEYGGYCGMVTQGGRPCTGTSPWMCSDDSRSRWRYVYDGTCSGGYCGKSIERQNCASDEKCHGGECVSLSVQEQRKEQVKNRIKEFFGKYESKCFNDWISLGDINKVEEALGKVEIAVDPTFLNIYYPGAEAVYCHHECIPFHYRDIVLRNEPNIVDGRTLWHEVMHVIFAFYGRDRLLVPNDEIYTWYMQNVDGVLSAALNLVEEEIREGKNCDCDTLEGRWQNFIHPIRGMEGAKNTPPYGSITLDAQIQELKDLTGFGVNVNTIKQHYEAGDCEQCVKLENAICGDHDEDGIGSACDDSPCGDNAHLSDCTCECDEGYSNCDGNWSNGCECLGECCPAGSPNAGTCYTPETPEEGCCQKGTECYEGKMDPEECRVCWGGPWIRGGHCEDDKCIPEFATIAIPVATTLLLVFLISRRKKKDRIKRN